MTISEILHYYVRTGLLASIRREPEEMRVVSWRRVAQP